MKATIMFYSDVSHAESFGHSLKKMEHEINNKIVRKITKGKSIVIPSYFVHESRFQRLSRYPRRGKGIGFGSFILDDLDSQFLELISLIPFQFNTLLVQILLGSRHEENEIIKKSNKSYSKLSVYLKECQIADSVDKTIYKLLPNP